MVVCPFMQPCGLASITGVIQRLSDTGQTHPSRRSMHRNRCNWGILIKSCTVRSPFEDVPVSVFPSDVILRTVNAGERAGGCTQRNGSRPAAAVVRLTALDKHSATTLIVAWCYPSGFVIIETGCRSWLTMRTVSGRLSDYPLSIAAMDRS